MRGHLPASRATKRQRRRPENEPRHCRACRRAAPCSAKQARAFSKQASASCAPCLRSSAPDAASVSRSAIVSLAPVHTSPPSQNGATAACHTRLHRTRHALEIWIGQPLSHGSRRPACEGRSGPPRPNQKLVRIYRMAGCAPPHPTLRPQTKRERHKSPAIPWTEPGTCAWAITKIGASAGAAGCELAAPCGAAVNLDYFMREKVPLAHTPPAVQPSSAQVSLSLRMIFVL